MFEKVNPSHPDKVADRIAGAIVDKCYSKVENPKVACEVLIGHGMATIIIETSVGEDVLNEEDVREIVFRVSRVKEVFVKIVPQDPYLANNQKDGIRCGDNGIFKGCLPTREQEKLTEIARKIYGKYPSDGKYVIKCQENLQHPTKSTQPTMDITICQSNMPNGDVDAIKEVLIEDYGIKGTILINPIGEWVGGTDVDCGATNRKLGSDMGDAITGGGLHGKDLSKADVSINIVAFLLARQTKREVIASCSIGDKEVLFHVGDEKRNLPYESVVECAGKYIKSIGGFEKFAEWGLV